METFMRWNGSGSLRYEPNGLVSSPSAAAPPAAKGLGVCAATICLTLGALAPRVQSPQTVRLAMIPAWQAGVAQAWRWQCCLPGSGAPMHAPRADRHAQCTVPGCHVIFPPVGLLTDGARLRAAPDAGTDADAPHGRRSTAGGGGETAPAPPAGTSTMTMPPTLGTRTPVCTGARTLPPTLGTRTPDCTGARVPGAGVGSRDAVLGIFWASALSPSMPLASPKSMLCMRSSVRSSALRIAEMSGMATGSARQRAYAGQGVRDSTPVASYGRASECQCQ